VQALRLGAKTGSAGANLRTPRITRHFCRRHTFRPAPAPDSPFDSPSVGNAPVHRFSRRVVKGSTPAGASHATHAKPREFFSRISNSPREPQVTGVLIYHSEVDLRWSYQINANAQLDHQGGIAPIGMGRATPEARVLNSIFLEGSSSRLVGFVA
jgi:hypothetical protein